MNITTLLIYIIFYAGFLLLIFFGTKKRTEKKKSLLYKDESDYVKGLAIVMVFLSHTVDYLEQSGVKGTAGLKPLSVLGGCGVLLFFFLSGYGLYKRYMSQPDYSASDNIPAVSNGSKNPESGSRQGCELNEEGTGGMGICLPAGQAEVSCGEARIDSGGEETCLPAGQTDLYCGETRIDSGGEETCLQVGQTDFSCGEARIDNGAAKIGRSFWKNRFLNMFIPGTVISAVSCIYICASQGFTFWEYLGKVFYGQWFVDVIMLEYLVFFVSYKLSKGRQKNIIVFNVIGCLILAAVFIVCGLDSRWYNGLLLFPAGMVIGMLEPEILKRLDYRLTGKNIFVTIALIVIFAALGGAFLFTKGSLAGDFIKTCSGIALSLLVIVVMLYLKLGNGAAVFIGKRSLYFYLCHLWLLEILFLETENIPFIAATPELGVLLLIAASFIYTEVMHLVFRHRL